jgi:hypothetical protein
MRRFGIGLLSAMAGYLLVAVVSYFLIMQLSSNAHDRSLEASMTSIFFVGPVGAVISFIIGFVCAGRGPAATAPER